jgi:hypothetical protein
MGSRTVPSTFWTVAEVVLDRVRRVGPRRWSPWLRLAVDLLRARPGSR